MPDSTATPTKRLWHPADLEDLLQRDPYHGANGKRARPFCPLAERERAERTRTAQAGSKLIARRTATIPV
jgi:hypothetical protein